MPRTLERTVYKFDELSDDAKEKARAWYRDASAGDNYFAESIIDDAKAIGELMGITIKDVYWSGFWSQGDGACFTGSYDYAKGSVAAVTSYAPHDLVLHRIARDLLNAQKRVFYRASATFSHRSRYSHEHSVSIECHDCSDDVCEAIAEALRDLMRWVYNSLEAEYEYQNANEQVDENIRANEYEFDEDGART